MRCASGDHSVVMSGLPQGSTVTPMGVVEGSTYCWAAINFSKPIMIVETSTVEQDGSKADWIEELYLELPEHFPQRARTSGSTRPGETTIARTGWPIATRPAGRSTARHWSRSRNRRLISGMDRIHLPGSAPGCMI